MSSTIDVRPQSGVTGALAEPAPIDLLACPECGGGLVDAVDANSERGSGVDLHCVRSPQHAFGRSDNGTPVLLREVERKALYGDLETAVTMRRDYQVSPMQRVAKVAKRAIGSGLHQPVSPTLREIYASLGNERALEVGSGFKRRGDNWVHLDIAPFANVDVVGSALHLPFQDDSFQAVHNAAVLEHVREPQRMIAEMYRVLAPGGIVYTEVPFLQHFHAYPNDFQRYTIEGLKQAFHEFEVVETGVCVGPSSAITALIADWFELFTFSSNRLVNDIARTIPLVLLWPVKYLDKLLVKNPRAHEVASGIYLIARKPSESPKQPS